MTRGSVCTTCMAACRRCVNVANQPQQVAANLCCDEVDEDTHEAIHADSRRVVTQASQAIQSEGKQQGIQYGKRQHRELLGHVVGTGTVQLG